MNDIDPTLVTGLLALLSVLGGGAGWLLRGRQRALSFEDGALGLYGDALSLLENAQVALQDMARKRDEMEEERDTLRRVIEEDRAQTRRALAECITARDESKLERAKDRVVIARLQEEVLKLQIRATTGETAQHDADVRAIGGGNQ